MSGLFSTFNVSKRGMNAQQMALNVTAHNVANANTEGYSVQRANLQTTAPFMMPSINSVAGAGQVGTGVEVSTITRARNGFLDYYIRKENGTQGRYEAREEFLSEIETVFMEPSDTGLSSVMGKFWDSWQQLSTTPESPTAKELVASNSETLANTINHNYWQLEKMEENAGDIIKNQINDVSSLLGQIGDLNVQIKAVVITGKAPNDLMDRRDLLLDQLSQRLNFEIEPTDFSGIQIKAKLNDGTTKSILTDSKVDTGISFIKSFDLQITSNGSPIEVNSFNKFPITIDKDATIDNLNFTVNINGDTNQEASADETDGGIENLKKFFNVDELKDNSGNITGYKINSIKSRTVFNDATSYDKNSKTVNLTQSADFDNGTIKGYETVNVDISDYKKQLNTLARAVAISVNTVHSNSTNADNTSSFFDISAETSDEPAKMLKVNDKIINDPLNSINTGKDIPSTNSGNGERALLIGQLRNTRLDILNIDSRDSFVNNVFVDATKNPPGNQLDLANDLSDINLTDTTKVKLVSYPSGSTIDSYFKDTVSNLGVKNQEAKRIVQNQEILLNQLETRKESISGVSLDEEMTNMIQFQRSYEANAKLINVIDQLLDVVVNGLIRR